MIPQTKEDYEALYEANYKLTGQGFNTTIHMPCMFCAAPDWRVFRVIESADALGTDAHCEVCDRGVTGKVTRSEGSVQLELYQSSGPAAPAWIPISRKTGL